MVSHDIMEVIRLSNRVFLMDHGKIISHGGHRRILPIEALKQMVGKLLRLTGGNPESKIRKIKTCYDTGRIVAKSSQKTSRKKRRTIGASASMVLLKRIFR
jgi:ABC-type proline/glycine betaine transport system ATPase subunit